MLYFVARMDRVPFQATTGGALYESIGTLPVSVLLDNVRSMYNVVALFAIWGLAQLVFSVFGVLALTRYRAMIPLLFVLMLPEHLARRWMLLVKPIARTGTPPGTYVDRK